MDIKCGFVTERGMEALAAAWLGTSESAEGDFFVASRITHFSKLDNAYEANGRFDTS